MEENQPTQQAERRTHRRFEPDGWMRIARACPFLPLTDATVLNVSSNGVAITTHVPLKVGDRLSFTPDPHFPPILAQVLASDRMDDGVFRVRCQCILGSFEFDRYRMEA